MALLKNQLYKKNVVDVVCLSKVQDLATLNPFVNGKIHFFPNDYFQKKWSKEGGELAHWYDSRFAYSGSGFQSSIGIFYFTLFLAFQDGMQCECLT